MELKLLHNAAILFRLILIAGCIVLSCKFSSAEADNRYCEPGNNANFGVTDGPAALPQSCFFTSLSATPSPGQKIHLTAGSNLQQVIDHAQCGDTLELPAGTAFRGSFTFPSKRCDDAHWVTIQSDGNIPSEGTRISPCFAGLRSLPGRPEYPCPSPSKAMAAVVVPPRGFLKVADHYRFVGLELTREPGAIVNSIVRAENANKVVFDRVWVHGNESDETQRGISFQGATFVAVINSYFSDFHCTARTGACVDSQALFAGIGDTRGGTYKIVDNFLEAASENILMGGAEGSATPADLEIRRNYFFKPLTWQTAPDPRFIVKNNFELKNASRVLIEGDVFENSWGGFSQAGFQLLLTPKSQSNLCPSCIVRDVTIRYCVFRHSGAGIQIASQASDSGGLSQGLMNVSIHDIVIGDINADKYAGNGVTFQISAADRSTFHDLSIRHVTAPVSDRILFQIGAAPGGISGVVIMDNVFGVGRFQASTTGGRANCAYEKAAPKDFFDACWSDSKVTKNVLIRGFDQWPSGNLSVKDLKSLGISGDVTNLNELKISAHKLRGRSQEDLPGADIDRIQSVLAGGR